jgi:hypothetical protein
MFTSFRNDPARIKKEMEMSSYMGRYMLDVPGQGLDLPFMEDAQVRIQKWGANLQSNRVDLEGELFSINRKISRDYNDSDQYKKFMVESNPVQLFSSRNPFVEESRSSHPAFVYRELETNRWESPWLNPQANLEKQFHDNIQTRILEKDNYIP